MKIILINPNLVALRKDFFTTGIPYMPIGLAYIAASLRKEKIPLEVIDAFGEKPLHIRKDKDFLIFGLTKSEIIQRLPKETSMVCIYANQLTNHISILEIISAIKNFCPQVPVIILENTQAVTAYSLEMVKKQFIDAGANSILPGEAEISLVNLILGGKVENKNIDNLDHLEIPAWDLFPLKNYWNLHFAHGPQSSPRYLPLLTSRGCPYACRFCFAPAANHHQWRFRSAKNVVDEIEYFKNKFKVEEFHVEDLNPTVSDERTRAICHEIIRRKLKIRWKIVAGTKAETIKNEETLKLMAQAGCHYISISPETGSQELIKKMGKNFNLDHAQKLIQAMHHLKIKSQACFVLGFPGETKKDLKLTQNLIYKLTKLGVDEIVLSIITPVPGSDIYPQANLNIPLSALNFSPIWRKDYPALNKFRIKLYLQFIVWKMIYHPFKVFQQILGFLSRKYTTKMEMTAYRAFIYKWLDLKQHLARK